MTNEPSVDLFAACISQERVHIAFGRCSVFSKTLGLNGPDKALVVPKDKIGS